MRELYARVARPLADAGTPGAWLADLPVMAIDGVQLDVADTADNEDAFGRGVSLGLDAPYPKVKVLGLGECGTHAVIDAHLGEVLVDERELARPLLASIDPGMLVLADRGFYSRAFWDEAAATGAQLLWRVQSRRRLASNAAAAARAALRSRTQADQQAWDPSGPRGSSSSFGGYPAPPVPCSSIGRYGPRPKA